MGVGHVGSLVKAYAEGWGFRVVCCDPPREERERCGFRTLEEVAREADILTFHTPLDASTRHMADSRLFGLMKPGAILMVSIILSTMFLKQHSVFDVVTGMITAAGMYMIVYVNNPFRLPVRQEKYEQKLHRI